MFVGINRKHNFSQILSIIIMAVVARRTFVSQFPGVNVCNITPAGCKVAPVVLLQPTDLGISTDSGIRTKREKIAAAARRFTFIETKTSTNSAQEVTEKTTLKASPLSNQTHNLTKKIEGDYSYVRGDLLKIMVLTAVIITVQVALVLLRQFLPNIALP